MPDIWHMAFAHSWPGSVSIICIFDINEFTVPEKVFDWMIVVVTWCPCYHIAGKKTTRPKAIHRSYGKLRDSWCSTRPIVIYKAYSKLQGSHRERRHMVSYNTHSVLRSPPHAVWSTVFYEVHCKLRSQ